MTVGTTSVPGASAVFSGANAKFLEGSFVNYGTTTFNTTSQYTSDGTLDNKTGATFTFDNATHSGTGTITNSGTFDYKNGAAHTGSGATVNNAGGVFTYTNSTHTSTGTITNSGTFKFAGASDFQGSGTITNNSGGTFTFDGTALYSGSGTIANNAGGTFTFGAGASYTGSGTVQNSGTFTFAAGSSYTSTTGTLNGVNNGVFYYASGMGGTNSLSGAFNRTRLGGYSTLHITGTVGSVNALTLMSAGEDNTVFIDDGGAFTGMNVRSAKLQINGGTLTTFSGDVVASTTTVNNTAGALFQADVDSDLIVETNATATFESGSSFANHNILVNTSGILNNESTDIAISNNKKFDNHGTYNNDGILTVDSGGTVTNYTGATFANNGTVLNSGTFKNQGTYNGTGRFTNLNEFYNTGAFDNGTASHGAISNSKNATMWFQAGTVYTGSGGTARINNEGTVNASAEIGDSSLEDLFEDLNLMDGGVFNLTADTDATIKGDFVIGASVATSVVNLNPNEKSITLDTDTTFDAGNAALNIQKGSVILKDNVTITTKSDFTGLTGSHLDFSEGKGYTATINAANAVFKEDSTVTVGEKNTLYIKTTGGTGTVTFEDKSTLLVADSGILDIDGSALFNGGSTLDMGAASVVTAKGDVTFEGDMVITVTATKTDISRVVSTDGDIKISSTGTVEIAFVGDSENIIGKIFLEAEQGKVENYDLLYNALYRFALDTSGTGEGVYVSGLRSVLEGMTNAFGGPDQLSVNKINGGIYTDSLLGTEWGRNAKELNAYLQEAGKLENGFDKSYTAYGQLFGEYAAYASTPVLSATDNLKRAVDRRMSRFQPIMGGQCDPCTATVDDYCDDCGNLVRVAVTGSSQTTYRGRRGQVWGGGLGDWIRQKDMKRIHGYDYSAGGVVLGYDYSDDCMTVGITGSYQNGSLKVNKLNTKFDSDMLNVMAYAAWVHESEFFIRGKVGYGRGWNEYDVGMVLGGMKHGKYQNNTFSAGLEVGYHAAIGENTTLIPSIGLDYTYLWQEDWTETLSRYENLPLVANEFQRERRNIVDIPVMVRLNHVFDMGDVVVVPEVRAAWVYRANARRGTINTGYVGSDLFTTMHAVDSGPSHGLVGGSIRALFNDCFEAGLDYTFRFQGGYRDHNLTGTVGVIF